MQILPATSTSTAGSAPAPAPTPVATPANQTISTTNFMKLLSTEMSNQDPMQPMDPTATMTQLAQFSSLQQATVLSQTQGLATANSFLGTQVTVPGVNGAPAVVGTVRAIDSSGVASGSPPELILSGTTQEYPLTSVSQITVPSFASSGASTTTSSSSAGISAAAAAVTAVKAAVQ